MNEAQFRQHVLPLKHKLYRLALRITLDSAEAEDIVQETFIRVWHRGQDNEAEDLKSVEAFAHTVCRNLSLDKAAKKEAANLSLDETPIDAPMTDASPAEHLEREERWRMVQQMLNALPERLRTAVHLRDVEDKTYKEIADIMGLTEDIVKVSLHRARKQLKKQLERIERYGL